MDCSIDALALILGSVVIKTKILLAVITYSFTVVNDYRRFQDQPSETLLRYYPPPETEASGAGLIAFTSDRDGNFEIYVMTADGSNQTRLTDNSANDSSPAWSPDGKKIAFASDRDGNFEIYVMNADGSDQTRLTNNSVQDGGPAWSPNGQRLAFTSGPLGNAQIFTMSADGSAQTRLTTNAADDRDPTWSPDGTKIAFGSNRDGQTQVYVMNADGSAQTRLTNNSVSSFYPTWSPNGTKIAFVLANPGNWALYVMNADGSNQIRLTNNLNALFPAWSPDSKSISFASDIDGNIEIYLMSVDGLDRTRLTDNPAVDNNPTWQPYYPPPETEVTPTEIVFFEPTTFSGQQQRGSCWTISIAAPREGAWRCASQTGGILDPCFSHELDQESVICNPAPWAGRSGFRLILTEPLPIFEPPTGTSAWYFELEDGTTCFFLSTGTTIFTQIAEPILYGCDDGEVILDVPNVDVVWTAEKARLSADYARVEVSEIVNIRKVWR